MKKVKAESRQFDAHPHRSIAFLNDKPLEVGLLMRQSTTAHGRIKCVLAVEVDGIGSAAICPEFRLEMN